MSAPHRCAGRCVCRYAREPFPVEPRRRAEQAREHVEETLLGGQALTDEELVEARGTLAVSKARTKDLPATGL
ncbi:hypothetical protein SALBM311S_02589 [Streptomyces alboniger]